MDDPTDLDQTIRAQDTGPILFWRHDFDLEGSEAVLRVRWEGGGLERSSLDGDLRVLPWATIADDPNIDPGFVDTVVWHPSEADRLAIPLGRLATYALQRVVPGAGGEIRTYFTGYLTRKA